MWGLLYNSKVVQVHNIWLTFLGCGPRGGESRSKPYIWNTHHYYHVQTIIDRWNESCICLITCKILIKYDYLSYWNYVNIEVSITYNMAWQIEVLPFQELFLYFSNSHFIKAYSNFLHYILIKNFIFWDYFYK